MTNFEKVGIFMKTFGQDVKTTSELAEDKINKLRVSLIEEELDELKAAIKDNDIKVSFSEHENRKVPVEPKK